MVSLSMLPAALPPVPLAPVPLPPAFGWDLVCSFVLALGFSLLLVPRVREFAFKADLMDAPNERKVHVQPTPRLGGVAIFASVVVTLGVMGLWSQSPIALLGKGNLGLLAGSTLIFLVGLLDDLFDLSPYVKLAGQGMAALVAFGMGVNIEALDLPGRLLLVLNGLSLPVTLAWLVGMPNAVNFIDGIDGLASGVGVLAALTLGLVAVFTGQPQVALLAIILAGACLGFWVHNAHPAKLFMGDSGALFIGFMLACLAVLGVLKTYTVVMLTPIVVLLVPVMDITYSTLRRLLKGKNPFVADGDHLHHRLLKAGLPQTKVVTVFYTAAALSGAVVAHYLHLGWWYLLGLVGTFVFALLLLLAFRGVAVAQGFVKAWQWWPLASLVSSPPPLPPAES